jgi:hypothetical protein
MMTTSAGPSHARGNARGTWYGLDVDDHHLIWSQWW